MSRIFNFFFSCDHAPNYNIIKLAQFNFTFNCWCMNLWAPEKSESESAPSLFVAQRNRSTQEPTCPLQFWPRQDGLIGWLSLWVIHAMGKKQTMAVDKPLPRCQGWKDLSLAWMVWRAWAGGAFQKRDLDIQDCRVETRPEKCQETGQPSRTDRTGSFKATSTSTIYSTLYQTAVQSVIQV